MKKMFISNLPSDASEDGVRSMFAEFGTVRSIHLNADIFTGKCRGFGIIEMEGHEARAALEGLNGKSYGGNMIKVRFDDKRRSGKSKGRR